jgi:hypothetical protein
VWWSAQRAAVGRELGESGLAGSSRQGKSEGEMRLGQGREDCRVGEREMTLVVEPSELTTCLFGWWLMARSERNVWLAGLF